MKNLTSHAPKQKIKDKEKGIETLSVLHTDHTDPYSISEAEKAAREKIRELIKMGHGSRTGRLKSWSEKVSMLADKLIELSEVSHVMEQNDAATDENIMFSDEMTAAAEIMIKKGKRILQLASQIKCARAQTIKRAQERKEAEERQWFLDTQHYHFYEVTPIPLTTKTEKRQKKDNGSWILSIIISMKSLQFLLLQKQKRGRRKTMALGYSALSFL